MEIEGTKPAVSAKTFLLCLTGLSNIELIPGGFNYNFSKGISGERPIYKKVFVSRKANQFSDNKILKNW